MQSKTQSPYNCHRLHTTWPILHDPSQFTPYLPHQFTLATVAPGGPANIPGMHQTQGIYTFVSFAPNINGARSLPSLSNTVLPVKPSLTTYIKLHPLPQHVLDPPSLLGFSHHYLSLYDLLYILISSLLSVSPH